MILGKALYFQLPVWYALDFCFSSLSFFFNLLRGNDIGKRCSYVSFVSTERLGSSVFSLDSLRVGIQERGYSHASLLITIKGTHVGGR